MSHPPKQGPEKPAAPSARKGKGAGGARPHDPPPPPEEGADMAADMAPPFTPFAPVPDGPPPGVQADLPLELPPELPLEPLDQPSPSLVPAPPNLPPMPLPVQTPPLSPALPLVPRRPPPPQPTPSKPRGAAPPVRVRPRSRPRPAGWPASLRMSDLPPGDRPRERMLQHGPATLSDAETLALVLGTGKRGLSALDLARSMLAEYGELRDLLRLGDAELLKVPGLGEAKIARLRASVELGRRYLTVPPQRGQALGNTSDVRTYLMQRFRDQPHEVFCCLFLDTRSRILAFEEMFQGSLDSAQVYIREVVRRAMDLNARSVIAVHNHPSGVPDPSGSDKRLTRRMSEALSLVDVRLSDHLIVGEGQVRSMAESGLM